MLKKHSMASKPITRHLRVVLSLGCLILTACLALAGGGTAWAPEDPWKMVVAVPVQGSSRESVADLMAGFVDAQGVNLSTDDLLQIAAAVSRESERYDLDPRLLMAVILTESRFQSDAVSAMGAIGLMQLLPSTASGIARELQMEWPGDFHLLDPEANIALGAFYLRQLMVAFDYDLNLALTAYNKGPGYVQNMLQSGVIEATAANFPSAYAEEVVGRLRGLRRQDG